MLFTWAWSHLGVGVGIGIDIVIGITSGNPVVAGIEAFFRKEGTTKATSIAIPIPTPIPMIEAIREMSLSEPYWG
jgi:hypothetical protein